MGVRNVLVLFFSAMAVSMVILIVFFSLFFKNFDNLVTFDTKLPESAPDLGTVLDKKGSIEASKSDGTSHSTINVPADFRGNSGTTVTSSVAPAVPKDPTMGVSAGAGVQPMDETELQNEPDPAATPDTTEELPATPVEKPKPKKKAVSPPVKPVKKETATTEMPPTPVLAPVPPASNSDDPVAAPSVE